MRTIYAIAYDLEGTVVNVEEAHHLGHIKAASDFGLTITLEDCFAKIPHFIGGPDSKVAEDIALLLKEQGKEVDPAAVLKATLHHYELYLNQMPIIPRPGFKDFYYNMHRLGFPQTIGSLTSKDYADLLMARSGLRDLFDRDHTVLKEDVAHGKPEPDVWIETARRVMVAPDQQVVFGDSKNDTISATKAGAYCIGMPVYNRPDVIGKLIETGARRIFLSWTEVSPAHLIANIETERSSERPVFL
jgi:beta-phosphoglucomutase